MNIIVIAALLATASMLISYAMMRGFRWAYQDGGWLFLAKSFAVRTGLIAAVIAAMALMVKTFVRA